MQAPPSADTQTLNAALARLGRDPRDVGALMDAGDAARKLGDFDAALGFYRRADAISKGNPRIKAGLASALMLSGDPVAAIPAFAEAERAGARPQAIASDRGLAHDLVGDNATAQRYYATVLTSSGDDELRMRLAISRAIAGDADGAEQTLMPLLRKQDKPGWRTRAFTLAIVGETKEAVDLADRILPAKLAQNVAPYLRYMPRLTKAQQAAAANLGRFPRASEIGRDEPRIAAYRPAHLAAADAALIPRGEQLGARSEAGRRTRAESRSKITKAQAEEARREAEVAQDRRKAALASVDADRVAPPEPRPTIEQNSVELPPVSASPSSAGRTLAAVPAPAPAPARGAMAAPTPAMPPRVPERPAAKPPQTPTPGFDLARVGTRALPSSTPESPPEPGPKQLSLTEIFADLGQPTTQADAASGAVDIRKILPAKPKPPEVIKLVEKPKAAPPAKPKKPAPPAHPSRIWVQIGVGRDKDAIAFDWRRYTRQEPELFKRREAYVSEMGRTNRILVGPFETQKAANQFVADLRKAGFEGALPWTSPAGQVVDPLSAKQ